MCRYYNNQVYCIRAQYKDLNPDSNATHTIQCLTHTDQGPSQTLRGHCVPLKTHDNFCRFMYYAKNKTYIVQLKRRYKRSLQITRQSLVFSDVFFGQCTHALLQYTALAFDYLENFEKPYCTSRYLKSMGFFLCQETASAIAVQNKYPTRKVNHQLCTMKCRDDQRYNTGNYTNL